MKKVMIIFCVVVLLGVASFVIVSSGKNDEDTVSVNSTPTVETQTNNSDSNATTVANDETFTAEQVAEHNSLSDCWTIISGDVFDLTSFVSSHPGGSEIGRACGIDGTTLFESRETESGESVGSGTPHSTNANGQLASFKIGTLAN